MKQFTRATILLNQGRYKDAEQILGLVLAEDPNNSRALAMMARSKIGQDQYSEALELIDAAIGSRPEVVSHRVTRSEILFFLKRYDEAELLLRECATEDPEDTRIFSLWSSIKLQRKQFADALNYANHALSLDPDDLLALNNRSTAQLKLNQTEEAFETIEGALERDPDNSYTHSSYGWSLLEKGDHVKALEYFSESLRLDPNNAYAQAGMAEALKAKFPLYRLFLKWVFFNSKLMAKYQWGIIIGFYLAFRWLRSFGADNPAFQWLTTPVLILMLVFALSTWLFTPLSDLFLRFNKYGKHLLDEKQKMSSTAVGVVVGLSIVCFVIFVFTKHIPFLWSAGILFSMMIPLSVMFRPAKYKNFMLYYAIAMGLVGLLVIVQVFNVVMIVPQALLIYGIGLFAIQFIANLITIEPN